MHWPPTLEEAIGMLGFIFMGIDYMISTETVENLDIRLERCRSLAEHGMSRIFHSLLHNKGFRLLLTLFLFIELILIDAFDHVYDFWLIIITILGFCIIILFPILILIIKFLQIVMMILARRKKGIIASIGFILSLSSFFIK